MKKRILACGEFSGLSTGYAVYMRGLLEVLHAEGYQIAELGVGVHQNDPRVRQTPWPVFPNTPDDSNTLAKQKYDTFPQAEYGAWQFEPIVNQFKPDVVLDIRDPWHFEFELRSPLRDYYATVIMPAVDAEPQNKQWLNLYAKADGVVGYTNWGLNVIKDSGFKVNIFGATPPMAGPEFKPIDKLSLKKNLGFENKNIIGMVARNQKRKLYPDLFSAFAQYLKETDDKNTYLYVHTNLLDRGWQIDEELLKYGIANRTLLTYVCRNCQSIEPSLYKGLTGPCYRCGVINGMVTANSDLGISNADMSSVYNLMDLYVQWATNEGYGIPPMEALACGVPVVGVDYSAMSEVISMGRGKAIKPKALYQELETGRQFAVPDNEALVKYFKEFFSMPSQMRIAKGVMARVAYLENWGIEKSYGNWVRAIESVRARKPWNAQPNLHNIPNDYPKNLDNTSFAKWLILGVLNRPEFIGSEMHARLIRDLNNGITPGGFRGLFYHELNAADLSKIRHMPYSQKEAFEQFKVMASENEFWEKARIETLK